MQSHKSYSKTLDLKRSCFSVLIGTIEFLIRCAHASTGSGENQDGNKLQDMLNDFFSRLLKIYDKDKEKLAKQVCCGSDVWCVRVRVTRCCDDHVVVAVVAVVRVTSELIIFIASRSLCCCPTRCARECNTNGRKRTQTL